MNVNYTKKLIFLNLLFLFFANSINAIIDLELTQTATNSDPAQYSIFSLTTTITNNGDETATNVEVEIPINNIDDLVYTGGNEFVASQGSFSSFGDEIWKVGTLAVGESATITTNYFVLGENDYTIFSQVVAADQTDDDSTPNNGTPPTPNEDDEVAFGEGDVTGGCNFSVTIIEIQCQPNQSIDDPSDDTFEAKLLIESNGECSGNYLINGNTTGTFGATSSEIFLGPYPISEGDVMLTISDFLETTETTLILEAPETCSNGANLNECGFENTYENIPPSFVNLRFQNASETDSSYAIETFGNAFPVPFQYNDLEVTFAGTEISNTITSWSSEIIGRADDGGFYINEAAADNQVIISKTDADGNIIWSNTQAFDSGGPQGAPDIRNVMEVPDGQVYLISAFGPQDWMWILKLDNNGELVYNNFLANPNGFNELYFHSIAENGDYLVYRHSGSRIGSLIRISTEGELIFEQGVVGDLVTSRFGGFAETPDGNFVYASYRDQLAPYLSKLDAFTGEIIWEINLTAKFDPGAFNHFAQRGYDVVATEDGGAIVGYNYTFSPNNQSGYFYGRLTGEGLTVWAYELPDTYDMEAELATADGGFLFAGNINGEYGLMKVTSQGLLTPICEEDTGECSISATAINIFCDDQGSPDNPLDDKFGFDILVTGNNTSGSFTATENGLGQMTSGQYDMPFTYPELFFIQNSINFSIADSDSSNCTTTLIVTPPAPCSDGINGVDLELNLETAAFNISPWTMLPVNVVITNAGNEVATAISIDIPQPEGANFAGGNEFSASQGDYTPYGNQQWKVGDLAASESATLTINYFVLTANNPLEIYAEVVVQNEEDQDSAPNNGTPPTVNEDDESYLILPNAGQNLIVNNLPPVHLKGERLILESEREVSTFNSPFRGTGGITPLQIVKAYPNPASDNLNLEIGTMTDGIAQIKLMNLQGQVLQFSEKELVQGLNKIRMDVSELTKGIYFVLIQKEDNQEIIKFVH